MKLLDHIIIVMQSLKANVKNKLLNVADFISKFSPFSLTQSHFQNCKC